MSYGVSQKLPSMRMEAYDHKQVVEYLTNKHAQNKNIGFGVCQYTHGATVASYGYLGGVYSPTQNRIYLIPCSTQSSASTWHYIDCVTGLVVPYTHGAVGLADWAFAGGVYVPGQDRIYFVPHGGTGISQTTWYYIECSTGAVVSYTSATASGSGGFTGGVYSPKQNRIYLVPFVSNTVDWLYIDCTSTPTTGSYTRGSDTATPYYCGCYSPTQDRIYFVPYSIANEATWHYIDCATGALQAYTHGATCVSNAYSGAVFSPIQNRIYFVPGSQSTQSTWHYIDCNTGAVVPYSVTPTVGNFLSGAYSPTTNRIYLAPQTQGNQTNWVYIDCNTGALVEYPARAPSANAIAYHGAVYSPTQNRVYFVPSGQGLVSTWHYIQEFSAADVSPALMASAMFNKF
jgi:hypothetical protein